ncbi:MAG TPA: Uma2 family endonuclease [Blastocatellia bacterium]|nr:Uma2 family endonuclease [Blastocatellia bacterium]
MVLPQSGLQITIEEYLVLEREAEERHEYLDGFIYVMAGETEAHGIISVNFVTLLHNYLRESRCQTFTKDT